VYFDFDPVEGVISLNLVTDLLRARIVESQEAAVAGELNGKHVSAVTNTHAAIEELRKAV
jgi:hypothetical protein